MAGITMVADVVTIKSDVFNRVVEGFMRQEMTKAIGEFLMACLARIPARTGFLKGSMADIVKFFKVRGTGSGQGGYSTTNEYYYPTRGVKILKRPLSGTGFATPPDQVIQRQGRNLIFNLDSDIRYWAANDFSARVPGAPWNSIKIGLAAMTTYLENAVNRFPKIDVMFTRTTIRVKGRNISKSSQNPNPAGVLATRDLIIGGF